jgi:hypothetical protein
MGKILCHFPRDLIKGQRVKPYGNEGLKFGVYSDLGGNTTTMGAPVIGLHIAFNGGFKAVERVFTRASIVTVAASRLASVWRSWRDRSALLAGVDMA